MSKETELEFNFLELTSIYKDGGYPGQKETKLEEYIRTESYDRVKQLLGLTTDHDDRTPRSEGKQIRQELDRLLKYYCIIEIASIIQFVPNNLSSLFWGPALRSIDNQVIKPYAFEKHPILIPQFMNRLEDKHKIEKRYDSDEVFPMFYEFLDMISLLEEDEDVLLFIELIQESEEYQTIMFWRTFESSIKLEACLAEQSKKTKRQSEVSGYFKYLDYIESLDSFIARCGKYPEIQRAFWHYHFRLFDKKQPLLETIHRTREISNRIAREFRGTSESSSIWDAIIDGPLSDKDEDEDEDIKNEDFKTQRKFFKAVERLTSGQYNEMNVHEYA